jgi:hypothetical protein
MLGIHGRVFKFSSKGRLLGDGEVGYNIGSSRMTCHLGHSLLKNFLVETLIVQAQYEDFVENSSSTS